MQNFGMMKVLLDCFYCRKPLACPSSAFRATASERSGVEREQAIKSVKNKFLNSVLTSKRSSEQGLSFIVLVRFSLVPSCMVVKYEEG